ERGMQTPIWRPGETWAVDFMQDMLADGRRFRTLNVLDTVTRECLAIEVDTSLPGRRVVLLLEALVAFIHELALGGAAVPIGDRPLAQGQYLTGNRLRLLLPLGRNARIEGGGRRHVEHRESGRACRERLSRR